MNKSDLVDRVAGAANVAKNQAEAVIDALFDAVKTAAGSGDRVAWPGFGSFTASQRKARTGRNPRTGAPVKIAASRGLKFAPSTALKDFMNNKSSTRSGGAKVATKKAAAPAKKASPAKKSPAKKAAPAKSASPAKKAAPAKKTPAKKAAPAKKASSATKAPAKKAPAKKASPAKKSPAKKATAKKSR